MDNLFGEYKIFSGKKLIYSEKNGITQSGRINALRALIGYDQRFAGAMSIGIGNNSNTKVNGYVTNTQLNYEMNRYPVNSWALDIGTSYSKIIFKAEITDDTALTKSFSINELGLHRSLSNDFSETNNSKHILFFDESDGFNEIRQSSYLNYSDYSSIIRIGSKIFSTTATSGSVAYKDYDSFSFGDVINSKDYLSLAFYKTAIYNATVQVFLFNLDELGTITASNRYDFTENSASGYIIKNKELKSPDSSFGTIDFSRIKRIRIDVSKSLSNALYLDGLKFIKTNTLDDTNSSLLSRAVLNNTVRKEEGRSLTIEYHLSLGFNE